MSIARMQPTRLALRVWVVLSILAALAQTAFSYQDPAKQFSETLKDNRPTQTAFTYQGQLKKGSVPADGTYAFRFALYGGENGGQKPQVIIKDDVVVTNGSFVVKLAFSSEGFSSNESWLEVGVRPASSADPYKALFPRQQLTVARSAITGKAEPWNLIGVPLGFSSGADTDSGPVDKIAEQSVTSEKSADGQAVTNVNYIKDAVVPPEGNTAIGRRSQSTLPLATQDTSAWTKVGKTVLLATDAGDVGIGTSKPVAKLDVAGTIHASEAVTVGNSVGLLSSGSLNLIEVDNSNPLAIGFSSPFVTNPNPVGFATIKVGIGTTGPTNTLDVNGQARIRVLPTNAALNDVVVAAINGVLFTRPASTISGAGNFWSLAGNALTGTEFLGSTNNFPLRVFTNNSERMRILDTNGNVGIATTTPTQRLTLGSGNVFLPTANGGTDGSLYFGGLTDTGQVGMRLFGGIVNNSFPGGFIDVMVNNPSDGLRFRVDTSNGGSERMRIAASGNVGIGTAAPASRFSVGNNTFQVDAAGNLVRINGVPYSWPAFQGAASTVLTNNGSGGLSWAAAAGGGVTGNCPSGANFVTKWSAITAVTCSQIFDNGTNVGIGTTGPTEKLEITGNFRLPPSSATVGVIKSGGNRFIHNFGPNNFFAGVNAGNLALSGPGNTGVGPGTLQSLTSGNSNTALGYFALRDTTTGPNNTAVGNGALILNVAGNGNTGVGVNALQTNNTGNSNTAVGVSALVFKTTGNNNTALGFNAGVSLTSGSNNTYISNSGAATESNTIRIGSSQTRSFIAGIRGVSTGIADAVPVMIDSLGQLGTLNSSRRFKEHIEDLGATSKVLYNLRPVSFLYKPEYGGRPNLRQFGLIAEEVAKVAPELVVYDEQGQPYSVHYEFLAPLLLNELQKKDTEIEKLRARLDALEKLVEGLIKK